MTMTATEKELAAVGISIAAGCKPCTNYHVKAARKADASDEDIARAVDLAVSVRTRATGIMREHGHSRLAGTEPVPQAEMQGGRRSRVEELICLGAAFGVNCVSTFEERLSSAETVGISPEEITELVRLAKMVKARAIAHVEKLWSVETEEEGVEAPLAH